jgi:hypothetical protein
LLCPFIFGSRFFPPISSAFSLTFSSSQAEEKKRKHTKNKTIKKKKNAKKRGSLPFFFRFYIWDEALLLLSLLHIPQALCLTSPPSFVLLKLESSRRLWRWNEREVR